MKLANLAGRAVLVTDDGTGDVARDSDGRWPGPAELFEPFEQTHASGSAR